MRRIIFGILLLIGMAQTGCALVRTTASTKDFDSQDGLQFVNLPRKSTAAYSPFASLPPELTAEFIRRESEGTLRGSQVSIVDESQRRYIGTILTATPDQIDLMSCLCREVVPAPGGRKQCKTSYVPYQSLKVSEMTHFAVLAPPQPDFPSPGAEIDPSDHCVAEFVFQSGRRQRWWLPPESDGPAQDSTPQLSNRGARANPVGKVLRTN